MRIGQWYLRRPAFPALALAAAALGLGCWARFAYPGGMGPLPFVGWLAALFILTTFAAACSMAAPYGLRNAFATYALLVAVTGALLLLVGCGSGLIGFLAVLRLFLLMAAWTALWSVASWAWRAAVPLTVTVAMLLMAAPVTFMPLARLGGAAAQHRVTSAIALASPLLAMIEALRPFIRLDWTQLPRMYELSALGQDMPIELHPWWVNTLCYTVAALLLAAARLSCRRLWPIAGRDRQTPTHQVSPE